MDNLIEIQQKEILIKTGEMKSNGYRLAKIMSLNDLTMYYCFVKDEKLVVLRFKAAPSEPVMSITSEYPYAYMYENEIKELFGVDIVNINIDFGGRLYDTAIKAPFRAVDSEDTQKSEVT